MNSIGTSDGSNFRVTTVGSQAVVTTAPNFNLDYEQQPAFEFVVTTPDAAVSNLPFTSATVTVIVTVSKTSTWFSSLKFKF